MSSAVQPRPFPAEVVDLVFGAVGCSAPPLYLPSALPGDTGWEPGRGRAVPTYPPAGCLPRVPTVWRMQDEANRQPPRSRLPLWPHLAIFLVAAPLGLFCAASDSQTGSEQLPFVAIGVGLEVVAAAYLWLTRPHTVARWRAASIRRYWFQPRQRMRPGPAGHRRRGAKKIGRAAMDRRQRRRR